MTKISDEGQVKEVEKKVKKKRREELEDLKKVLALAEGKRLLWRYLEMCGVYKSSVELDQRIYFNEGKRDIGLRILADITEANDEALIQMMRQARREEELEK